MERPKRKDFRTYGEYDIAINNYCDELEEKEKPKMVKFKKSTLTFYNDQVDVYCCPTCGFAESTRGTSRDLFSLVNYCTQCGQKLLHKGDNHE